MDPLVERDISQVDEAQVLAFITAILDGECGLNVHRRLARSVHRYFIEFQPGLEDFVALTEGDAIRGLMAIDHLTESKAILKWFFVAPDSRNAGLGSRMLKRALRFAREKGYRKLVLGTMRRMDAAQHLYAKHGFLYKQQVTFWGRPMMVFERTFDRPSVSDAAAAAPFSR
jgi:GNAT superfamily N-acetyltransferase